MDIEQTLKQHKCDIAYLKDTVRTLAESNKRYLKELQGLVKDKTANKDLYNRIARLDTYVKKLEKAAKLEAEVESRKADKDGGSNS